MGEAAVRTRVVNDGVLVIEINRPHARNAVTLEVSELIAEAVERLDGDQDLAVGVLTGAGGTFCAGMDLKAFAAGERAEIPERGFGGLVEAPPRKPLLAAIEGFALAGGFELALACDLIVAGRDAVVGLPEVTRSLVAIGGGLIRLPRRVPYHVAMEICLTGAPVSAERAYVLGIINRLVESGNALSGALDLAEQIRRNGPLAVQATKAIASQAKDWTESEAWRRQHEIGAPVFDSYDAHEGAVAFAQKRPPVWRGR